VLDAAMKVHTALGPGLLESAYRACLQHELVKAGHRAEAEVALPVVCDGITLDVGYRLDLLVDNCVIVELKAAERITPVYEAQIISYLKLSGKSLGLLINFKVAHLRGGIKRFVNGAEWRNPN
jgi:GxxExxY protein